MKVLLWSYNIATRLQLESTWAAEGATMLKKNTTEVPDCIVVDLAMSNVLRHIERLRGTYPQVDIIAFGAKFDAEMFEGAIEAGATDTTGSGGDTASFRDEHTTWIVRTRAGAWRVRHE